jgi:hypothetical protein
MTLNDSPDGILAKWSITNFFWVALIAACWHQGWLSYIFEKDVTFISHGIALSGVVVLILSFWKALKISSALRTSDTIRKNYLARIEKFGESARTDIREALKTDLMSYVSFIEYFATSALAVGVLGTVVGLVMGFSTLDPSDVANIENAGPAVAQLLKGMSVAFHTTLVGGIINLWLRTNHFLLIQGQANLFSKIMGG